MDFLKQQGEWLDSDELIAGRYIVGADGTIYFTPDQDCLNLEGMVFELNTGMPVHYSLIKMPATRGYEVSR